MCSDVGCFTNVPIFYLMHLEPVVVVEELNWEIEVENVVVPMRNFPTFI